MYSVVLMMAMSGGAELPQWHGCRGGNGCYGGYGHGCYGGGYGCYGGGWGHGCRGGWGHGCRGGHGLFSRHRGGCNGCYGGGYGCYGGGYGYGCYGGGYGNGCYGGGYGSGCYGGGHYQAVPAAPAGTPAKEGAPVPQKTGFLAAPATIVVSLPADAKLMIDDTATKATSANRVFTSPVLEPGKDYFYTLKAEMNQDGKTVTTTKRITVRAGEETRVNLELTESVVSR
jgi:uncharacterized protein (TIGR03000 family)